MANSPHSENGVSLLEVIIVTGLVAVIGAFAVPMFGSAIASFRVSGDARSVMNAVAVAKMRAAADFSRSRLYVDLSADTFHLERWDKTTSTWVTEGGTSSLSSGVSFGYGVITVPPPNTQGVIGQAAQCIDDMAMPIANTACFMFNSRGVPIDASFAPTSADALYVTDGAVVYAVTVAATGMSRMFRALPVAIPAWVLN